MIFRWSYLNDTWKYSSYNKCSFLGHCPLVKLLFSISNYLKINCLEHLTLNTRVVILCLLSFEYLLIYNTYRMIVLKTVYFYSIHFGIVSFNKFDSFYFMGEYFKLINSFTCLKLSTTIAIWYNSSVDSILVIAERLF